MRTNSIFNIPNLLTCLRVVAVPVVAWLLLTNQPGAALLVFIGAQITDGLDGIIARALKQFTRLGAILDPVADKLLGLTALSLLVYTDKLPMWLLASAVFRDTCIATAVWLLTRSGRTFPARPTRFGKYGTFFLAATVLVALVHNATPGSPAGEAAIFALSIIALECMAVSWAQYLYQWIQLMRQPPPPRAPSDPPPAATPPALPGAAQMRSAT